MTTRDILRGGDFAHGERQQVTDIAGQGGIPLQPRDPSGISPAPQIGAPGPGLAQAPLPIGGDPLEFLQGTEVAPDSLTSGLSVGPGEGPRLDPVDFDALNKIQKYEAIAKFAKTPQVKALAAAALRRILAEQTAERRAAGTGIGR